MSLSHVVPGNSNQEEQEARMAPSAVTPHHYDVLGFPKDFCEFRDMCEELDNDWTVIETNRRSSTLKERLDEKTRLLKASQGCSDLDDQLNHLSLDAGIDSKESNRKKFEKHSGGRKNKREERRREMRARLKKRNAKNAARRVERKNVEPHALPVGNSSEQELNEFTEERNKMVRIATETQESVSELKLPDLLKSVSSFSQTQDFGEYSGQIDDWVSHLENIVILGYDMSKASSFTDIFMAVVSYAKKYCNGKSIVMELYQIIDEVTTSCNEDADQVEPHSWRDITGQDIIDK